MSYQIMDKMFDMLLDFFGELVPLGGNFPYHSKKKIIGDLRFSYEKINACLNDCMFY